MNKNLEAVKNSLVKENGNRPYAIGETTIKVDGDALMVMDNGIYILAENASEDVQDFIVRNYKIPNTRTYNKSDWHVYRNKQSYKESPLYFYNCALRGIREKFGNDVVKAPQGSGHHFLREGRMARIITHRKEYQNSGTYCVTPADLDHIDDLYFVDYDGTGNKMIIFVISVNDVQTFIKENNIRKKGKKDGIYYVINTVCFNLYTKEKFSVTF
jgi:hypothetical protein